MNILITGGTGLLGSKLVDSLLDNNFIKLLSRRSNTTSQPQIYQWDYTRSYIDELAIKDIDVVIHLSGENISARRWTKDQKIKIYNSRIKATQFLFEQFKQQSKFPKLFISASAVGYYGHQISKNVYEESDISGSDFLARTVVDWEKSVKEFEELGTRVVQMRLGVVIAEDGGAFRKMLSPIMYGIGSALGSGDQYMPWVEIRDVVKFVNFSIQNESISGPYNLVAPEYIMNKELMAQLAKAYQKPFIMPSVPAFVLKMIFGEMSQVLLYGSRVSSHKLIKEGFEFSFKSFKEVLDSYQT